MLGVSHLLGEVEDWPAIPGMFGNMQLDMAMVQGTVGGLSISPPLPGDEEGWFGTLTNPGGGPSTTVEVVGVCREESLGAECRAGGPSLWCCAADSVGLASWLVEEMGTCLLSLSSC